MPLPPQLPAVMTYQEAVTALGHSRVLSMIRLGLGQRPCRGIYVTHNGPITLDQRELIALKASAPGAALAGLSALRHDGFTGFDAELPTVVQPIGSTNPPYEQLIPHWSKWLDDRDVHPLRRPRRTRPQRSLIDAASWASSDQHARVIIIAGVQQGLVNTRMLREALQRRGTCRRRALIVQSILDAHGGIQSLPERDFRGICHRFGLPRPSHQVRCKGPDGRYYLDAAWEEYDIAVEVHGIPHLRIRNWDGDLDRGNEISILGKRILIFSSFTIRHRADHVGDQLVRMLRANGWTGDEGIGAMNASAT